MPLYRQFRLGVEHAATTAEALAGGDYALIDTMPRPLRAIVRGMAPLANRVPERLRRSLYRMSGVLEAVPPAAAAGAALESVADWAVDRYPRRRYPAALIGASNGAAVHLAAALGAPSLPQFLSHAGATGRYLP